jgi:hypothetical protein
MGNSRNKKMVIRSKGEAGVENDQKNGEEEYSLLPQREAKSQRINDKKKLFFSVSTRSKDITTSKRLTAPHLRCQ